MAGGDTMITYGFSSVLAWGKRRGINLDCVSWWEEDEANNLLTIKLRDGKEVILQLDASANLIKRLRAIEAHFDRLTERAGEE